MIRVQLPDGKFVQIDTDDPKAAVIAARKYVGSQGGSGAQTAQPAKRSLLEEAGGALANFNAAVPFGDEFAATGNTVTNVLSGKVPLSGVVDDFKANMGTQRRIQDRYMEDRPKAANLAKGAGMAITAAVPVGKTVEALAAAPRAVNMARGAVTAAATGAGVAAADRGTVEERVAAASKAATDPVTLGLGAAFGGIAPSIPSVRSVKPTTDASILADAGVSTTIPQKMGGGAKTVEDLLKRFPIIGQAITGANARQIEQLNRAVALKALEPVGIALPKTVKPGFEMVEHVDDALGAIYDKAAKLVPQVPPEAIAPFKAQLASIAERKADLPETVAAQYDSIVASRLARLDRPDASGALVKQIHGELGKLQAEAARKGETTLSGMIGDTRQAVMGIIADANPQAAALIKRADKGWQVYSILNDAAASASNRGGVFLPGQLNTQVRGAGRSMGTNMTGKGKAPLQDLATAATRTIPDGFGNPGTANAALLSGGGVGLVTAPGPTVAAAAGLTAASTPYFLMARKIMETLPESASQNELRRAAADLAKLSAKDPAVDALRSQVAARLSRAAGVATAPPGGSEARP
jgi:hypothetical protein